jgi:CO/xanthine dehydrogenase Mo-binding subunit
MGMSHALYETTEPYYPLTDHSPKDFSEYLMPGPWEVPRIDSVVLEMPSSNGPYGVKGVGEMTANSPIPAIVNAIYHACGVRIDDLPVTPEKILRGLEAG